MRYSYTALVLATMAIGQAVASPFKHMNFHSKKQAEPAVAKRSFISESHAVKLLEMGLKSLGHNSETPDSGVWFGDDGPYTNEFHNESGEDLSLVLWGPHASWVNVNSPLITTSIANGSSTTISFASGQTGAWSAVYEDTELRHGQVSNTWGEYTFSPDGVVDVSKLPNMHGHNMTIVGPKCVTNMEICVFECLKEDICMYDYELLNCEPGSQDGAQKGYHFGAASGGCGGFGESAHLHTYLS